MGQKETIGIKTNRNTYTMEVSRHMIKKEKNTFTLQRWGILGAALSPAC